MPQEINKETLTAHVRKEIERCKQMHKTVLQLKTDSRTDAERFHHMGECHRITMGLIRWEYTAVVFGIEIPEEDDK